MDVPQNHGDAMQGLAAERLTADLGALYAPVIEVPAEVDARIAHIARSHFSAKSRRRTVIRWLSSAAAAAAVLVVASVWVLNQTRYEAALERAPDVASAEWRDVRDLDASGNVDILDAFALARRIEANEGITSELDLTRDGSVDRRDVDALALAAVRLNPEGGQ